MLDSDRRQTEIKSSQGLVASDQWQKDTNHELTSGNILKTSVVMGRIPLVSTSYLSLVPAGVFLLVVNRKEGALQQRDRDILEGDTKERREFFMKDSRPKLA